MENQIKVFENAEFGQVRTVIDEQGEPWFVAADVCKVLELSNPTVSVGALDDDERAKFNLGRQGESSIINEPGLYSLVIRSRKPEAKTFKRWITHDVIPTIRKTGSYSMAMPKDYPSALRELANEYEKRVALEEQAKIDAPKVQFADTVIKSEDNIKIREMAKLLVNDGVNIGQNRLFKLLREKNILMESNESYQKYADMKYFFVNENHFDVGDKVCLSKTTLVTPKGQLWLSNKIKEWLVK